MFSDPPPGPIRHRQLRRCNAGILTRPRAHRTGLVDAFPPVFAPYQAGGPTERRQIDQLHHRPVLDPGLATTSRTARSRPPGLDMHSQSLIQTGLLDTQHVHVGKSDQRAGGTATPQRGLPYEGDPAQRPARPDMRKSPVLRPIDVAGLAQFDVRDVRRLARSGRIPAYRLLGSCITKALDDRALRLTSIGVGTAELRRYGSPAEHEAAWGLDPAELRRSITNAIQRGHDAADYAAVYDCVVRR